MYEGLIGDLAVMDTEAANKGDLLACRKLRQAVSALKHADAMVAAVGVYASEPTLDGLAKLKEAVFDMRRDAAKT